MLNGYIRRNKQWFWWYLELLDLEGRQTTFINIENGYKTRDWENKNIFEQEICSRQTIYLNGAMSSLFTFSS